MSVLEIKNEMMYANIVTFLRDKNEWEHFEEYYETVENFSKLSVEDKTFHESEFELEDLLDYCGSDVVGIASIVDEYWEGTYFIEYLPENIGYIRIVKFKD